MDGLEQLEACRICVTCFPLKDMDFINIFQPNAEFQQELDFIQAEIQQWDLKIHPDDGLPQRICANCFAKFCSIETFRKECQAAQKKLIETVLQQTAINEPQLQHDVIKNTEVPLPLVGNYENGNVSLESGSNILVSSVNVTQTDVSLNDFPVFDQQFSQYDNPALIDASSTLLDNNFIAPETTQELDFLPSQNLFTFETAEPPSTGTLPLDETETTSIMNDILVEKSVNEDVYMKHDDLEDMLKHSIIPTTTKLTTQRSRLNLDQQERPAKANVTNTDCNRNQYSNSHALKFKSEFKNTTVTFLKREDNSDVECEDTDMNARLKGFSYACHYCFCPETGPVDHLVFPNEDALSQHFFDVHEPNRPYTCPKCPQSSKTKLLRDNHVRLIHKIIEYQTCNYCHKHFKSSTEVHQYNCHYVSDWKCEQCGEKFSNTPLYRFRLHQRQHDRTKQFKCRLCERSFVRKANLEAHQRIHKAEAQSTFTCDVCKANFADSCELKRHKCRQHNAEAPHKCKLCKKGFSSNVFLQRHINQSHSDKANINNYNNNNNNISSTMLLVSSPSSKKKHVCLYCKLDLKSLENLQEHLQYGRDKSGNCLHTTCSKQERRKIQLQGVFPCFHCPRRFHLRSQLDKHLNTHDARLRPFQCEQCLTRCRTSFELKQHVNIAHLNIKAFSCDKCGKCFGYKKDLRDHMLFHAEINVRCTEEGCTYVCKNEKALNDHIRHKHRLLSCEYCHEQFTRQKLTAHLRKIHRAEIDVELACESDNFYKSQLLNNNNDITQISFNLLNAQQGDPQLTKTTPQPTPTSVSSQILVAALNSVQLQTQTQTSIASTSSSSALISSASSSLLTPSSITTIATSSPSLTSCLTNNTPGTSIVSNSSATSCISAHNLINDVVDNSHAQLCDMFANDAHDSSSTSALALNGLVSNEHDLNLVANDTANMFLVPSTSSSANDSQLDQYFMASLIDTEQEIIVT